MNRGKKVVLFTADIIEDIKAIDKHFSLEAKESGQNYEDATMVITNKLLKLACAYSQGISGTTIMCYNEADKNNTFLNNDLFKICKKIN